MKFEAPDSGVRGRIGALLARPEVRRVLDLLDREGEEARVVGGAVRNAFIGRPVTDIDIATTATPDVVIGRAAAAGLKPVPTGVEQGTVTVVVEGAPVEVTTLREDVGTDGRHATVRFGRDFSVDARRRDFTMNALSLGADGLLHDPVGGMPDLASRRVVFIGDPAARIREDFLRILRFFRFHAEFGEGPLDAAGLSAVIAERAGLAILSRERVRAELLKLLAARRAVETAQASSDCGLMQLLIGGVVETGRLERTVRFEEEGGRAPDAIRRLAALAVATREDADRLREALRLANAEHERLLGFATVLSRLRSIARPLEPSDIRRLVVEHGPAALSDALAAAAGEPKPVLDPGAQKAFARFNQGKEPAPAFPLRGADLIERGVPAGPQLGALLAQARETWLAAGCPSGDGVRDDLLAALGRS